MPTITSTATWADATSPAELLRLAGPLTSAEVEAGAAHALGLHPHGLDPGRRPDPHVRREDVPRLHEVDGARG